MNVTFSLNIFEHFPSSLGRHFGPFSDVQSANNKAACSSHIFIWSTGTAMAAALARRMENTKLVFLHCGTVWAMERVYVAKQ